MLPLPPGTLLLRTGEKRVYGIDLSDALLPGEALTAISAVICQKTTQPPFANQWQDDSVTLISSQLTGSVNGTALTSAGGTYAANASIPLIVGAPAPGGRQAVAHATTNGSGVVQSALVIDDEGDGYATAPTLTFPAAQSGGTATATSTILLDTISVSLDATRAPAVVGEWRRVIGASDTNIGENDKGDEILIYTDL